VIDEQLAALEHRQDHGVVRPDPVEPRELRARIRELRKIYVKTIAIHLLDWQRTRREAIVSSQDVVLTSRANLEKL
jgi:hypothetical protein